MELQPQAAQQFGYTSNAKLLASEKFMRDYYRRAQELCLFSEAVIARTLERDKRTSRWFGRQRSVPLAEPFSIKDGKLHLDAHAQYFTQDALHLFDASALAQAANVAFGHGLLETMRRHLGLITRQFRESLEAANAFRQLLRRRGRVAHVLRLMHDVGLLSRYLPEFGRISLLIQHDLYHHYTSMSTL